MEPIDPEQIAELEIKYPGLPITKRPEVNPQEVLVELPSSVIMHGTAIVLIRQSAPHYHLRKTQVYEVLDGTLSLCADELETVLHQGDIYIVRSGLPHSAKSLEEKAVKVKVTSFPNDPTDHHLVRADTRWPLPIIPTVHSLFHGQPLCGFTNNPPGSWPDGQRWEDIEDRENITCPGCKERAEMIAISRSAKD
jgi:mannose-6-phosphate isomerase-like protein (cupin superfamily)